MPHRLSRCDAKSPSVPCRDSWCRGGPALGSGGGDGPSLPALLRRTSLFVRHTRLTHSAGGRALSRWWVTDDDTPLT